MENTEIWKTYREKQGLKRKIEVSNFGNVRVNGILKVFDNTYTNYKNGGPYFVCGIRIHKMVAELFIPNPDNKPFIDHIDTNIHNNRADNLRWVTQKENVNNSLTLKHMSESQTGKILPVTTRNNMSKAKSNNDYVKNRIHINNGIISKMIYKDELEYYLSIGFVTGRIYHRKF